MSSHNKGAPSVVLANWTPHSQSLKCTPTVVFIALLVGLCVRPGFGQPIQALTQSRLVRCVARATDMSRCEDGISSQESAPDLKDFEAIVAQGASCLQAISQASAEQKSYLRPDSIDIYVEARTVAMGQPGFGYAMAAASSNSRITFRIDPSNTYGYELRGEGTTYGFGGLGTVEMALRHPDARIDSLRMRAYSQWDGDCCQATRKILRRGPLEPGEYSLVLEANAQHGLFTAWATFKLHFEVRPAVPVESITWTRVKVLFR